MSEHSFNHGAIHDTFAMPHLTRQARQALTDERRRQILEAAVRVFAQRGYATATVSDVARAARVSEGTIYNYFRSKDDLLIHIPRHLAAPVFEQLHADLEAARTLDEVEAVLRRLARRMLERLATHLDFVKLFLSVVPHLNLRARREYARTLPLVVVGILEAHLRRGMAAGLYHRDLDPAIAARALPGLLLTLVIWSVAVDQPIPGTFDHVAGQVVRLYLQGIARPATSGTSGRPGGAGARTSRRGKARGGAARGGGVRTIIANTQEA